LLGGFAVGAYYAGHKITGLWIGFAGVICLLLLATLQIQQILISTDKIGPNDSEINEQRAYVSIEKFGVYNFRAESAAIFTYTSFNSGKLRLIMPKFMHGSEFLYRPD